MTQRERRRRSLAKAIGEDVRRLQEIKAGFVDRLMRSGVIVDLDIGRWRGAKRLTKADLGLSPEAFADVERLLEYGQKRLLPVEITNRLNSLETQARANLDRHGFRTAFGVFVPAKAYGAWKTRHQELEAQYLAMRDEIAEGYEAIKADVLAQYRTAARDAWDVTHGGNGNGGGTRRGLSRYREEYLGRIAEAYPAVEMVRASFRFDFTLAFIPLTSTVMKEEAAQAEIEAERRMRAEVAAHYATRKREMVDRFLADVVGQLRTLVYDVCNDVLTSIKSNGKLISRSAVQLRNLLDRVGQLNVYGDADVERKLREVVAVLDAPRGKTERPQAAARLETLLVDLQETCREAKDGIENVDPMVERFLALEMDDEPSQPKLAGVGGA